MANLLLTLLAMAVLCSTTSVAEDVLQINITLLHSAIAEGAVCLDGSPPAYLMDRGSGSGLRNWIIYLHPGGWCDSIATCLKRTAEPGGSSKHMEKQSKFAGILYNSPQIIQPVEFYNWNRVRVNYCDGASFTGDVDEVDPDNKLFFRGARIFKAIMDDLLRQGMQYAENGSAKNLHPSCTSIMEPSLCFFPQNVIPFIETPLFIINSAYDSWQINNTLVPDFLDPQYIWDYCKVSINNCTFSQRIIIQGFGVEFLKVFKGLSPSNTRGYFITSCHSHGGIQRTGYWSRVNSPRIILKKALAEAVADWFFDRAGFHQYIDPYPCARDCDI